MSTNADPPGIKAVPNKILISKREERGWSRGRAVREIARIGRENGLAVPSLESLNKSVYRHETGQAEVRDPLYIELYCRAYEATPHDLFGDLTSTTANGQTIGIRSHKFIPSYLGSDIVHRLIDQLQCISVNESWLECSKVAKEFSNAECHLYLWPFGIGLFHVVEELEFPNIAQLAVWRRHSYQENRAWAKEQFQIIAQTAQVSDPYVLSLYWLYDPIWSNNNLENAGRILSMPRVLLERSRTLDAAATAHAELVEKSLLQDGFTHPEIIPFGVKGISLAFASWAGVVYHPLAPRRALSEKELIDCELAVQSVWSYCDYIRSQIEEGKDPIVPEKFGWRFLRGMKSRLTHARPHESAQHRSMREAILATSGLPQQLSQAVETLRETNGV
jgi:hypothetical protein